MDIDNLYQELIIDHGTDPRNHFSLPNASHTAEGYNPLCGDKVHIYLQVQDNVIVNVSFTGQGCAISTASASIMSEALKGKTITYAMDLFAQFQKLLTSEMQAPETLGKLAALSGVRKFPSRVKCATLPWHTLQKALSGDKDATLG